MIDESGRATTVAIMQPYFFPYVGYFQLMAAVDVFVVYDNIQYTKQGWINRNRILRGAEAVALSLPLKKASDYVDVRERELAASFRRDKMLNQIRGSYRRAPYFDATFALIEAVVRYDESNLFRFIHHSIARICEYLGLTTVMRVSSHINIDHGLRSQDKVIALCRALGAVVYVNTIGGVELYSREAFRAHGIHLKFMRSLPFEYRQFGGEFIPSLSIIDVLMFNPLDTVRARIACGHELI